MKAPAVKLSLDQFIDNMYVIMRQGRQHDSSSILLCQNTETTLKLCIEMHKTKHTYQQWIDTVMQQLQYEQNPADPSHVGVPFCKMWNKSIWKTFDDNWDDTTSSFWQVVNEFAIMANLIQKWQNNKTQLNDMQIDNVYNQLENMKDHARNDSSKRPKYNANPYLVYL